MRTLSWIAGLLALGLHLALPSWAVPVPALDLAALVAESDLVLVGELAAPPEPVPARGTHSRTGRLRVRALYKGDVAAGAEVTLHYLEAGIAEIDRSLGVLTPRVPRLYFLKRDAEGSVRPTSAVYPDFPVLATRPKLQRPHGPREAVEAELLNNAAHGEPELAAGSLFHLWSGSKRGLDLAQELAWSPSLVVRASAAAYRLRSGDRGALEEGVRVMEAAARARSADAAGALQSEVVSRAPDVTPQQIRRLVALRDPSTDYTAAQIVALKGEPRLASLAVELLRRDRKPEAQYAALGMLSRLRRAPRPAWPDFARKPGAHVQPVLRWWEREGRRRYPEG